MTLHVLNSACSGFQTNRPSSCCWPPCGLRGHIRDRVKPRARKKVDSSTSCVFLLLLGSFFRIIRAILSLLFVLEIPSGKIYTYHLHRKNISGQIIHNLTNYTKIYIQTNKSNHPILPFFFSFSE